MRGENRNFSWRPAVAVVALACAASSACAEIISDRYWGGLEYFYPNINTSARIDATSTNRPGSSVSFEQELDLSDRKGTPYANFGMRLGDNWRIEFEGYALKRTGHKAISRQIDFGDASYPIGADLATEFDSTIYRLTGGWSFIKNEQAEAGVAFGLHVTDFQLQLSGQGTGVISGAGFQRELHQATVPLPTLGLYGTYMITPQLGLRGRFDFLSFNYDQYDGRLLNWLAALDWRFSKNVGAGVGYRYVDYKLDATKNNFTGEVRYTFKGPTIFINAGF